jgi:Domain of unknown function (DUF4173)
VNPEAISDSTMARPESRSLGRILAPVALATVVADFLFWRSCPGVSVGIFLAVLAAMLLAMMRGRPGFRIGIVAVALGACCVQAGIELSMSNVLASVALLLALAGEVFQSQMAGLWERFAESLLAMMTAPMRWLGLGVAAIPGPGTLRTSASSFTTRCLVAGWVLTPAVILLLVFTIIFRSGNAIFGEVTGRLAWRCIEWIGGVDLHPGRFILWAVFATFALGLFHGRPAPESARWWSFPLPRFPRPDWKLAGLQSGAVLLALNALFFFVNTIDAIYLWAGGPLPAGVGHSEFVHQGVWSLTGAVVLSAFVIAGLFQQEDRVADHRWLKNLAHLWVVQNLVLIGGVFLRLKIYVMFDNQLTEKRVYVGCFLLLVSIGFVFLAYFVEKRRTFNWLLGRNAIVTFLLFFILQFPDVRGMIARCNTALWIAAAQNRDPESFDLEYNASLGPAAWSQLVVVAASERAPRLAARAREELASLRRRESVAAATETWREWQWRRSRARARLLVATGEMP